MMTKNSERAALTAVTIALAIYAAPAEAGGDKIEAALATIRVIERPGRDNFATVWDGNKYVQCRRMEDRSLRCEAAGALMQVSLAHILTPQRVRRLAAMGWVLDPSFGNYVQTFGPDVAAKTVAAKIRAALAHGYDADTRNLEFETKSIVSEPCPPRNGPSQNLAGIVNDAPAMAATAVHACAYTPKNDAPKSEVKVRAAAAGTGTTADLVALYGPQVTAEILRLRVNIHRRAFVAFDTGAGYVQCETQTEPEAFYCEAQSADSWSGLAAVLTPARIARLHDAGFADPGRAPNYSKTYRADKISDAALAVELLKLLHDVYGYDGARKLKVATEEG